jgi:hypothetical protein
MAQTNSQPGTNLEVGRAKDDSQSALTKTASLPFKWALYDSGSFISALTTSTPCLASSIASVV